MGKECVVQCPPNSTYEKQWNKCVCKDPLVLVNGKCVEKTVEPPKPECYEFSSWNDYEKKCICWAGYQLKDGKCQRLCPENSSFSQWDN